MNDWIDVDRLTSIIKQNPKNHTQVILDLYKEYTGNTLPNTPHTLAIINQTRQQILSQLANKKRKTDPDDLQEEGF